MKRLFMAGLLTLLFPAVVFANDKIDPEKYLCAELISEPVIMQGEPPLFEGLQMDGYVSAGLNDPVASPEMVGDMLKSTFLWCQNRQPEERIFPAWRRVRQTMLKPESHWNAEKTTCAEYAADPDDGSGFIIWLDGYNRASSNTDHSILNSDADVQAFIAACKAAPKERMLDVLRKCAKAPAAPAEEAKTAKGASVKGKVSK